MATTENLERLEGLVKTLSPLANKRSGELIEAAQWNQLVGGVLEVARAGLAQPVDETVPEHKHTDGVSLEWLTPKLRALVTEGGLSDPTSQAAFAKLERKVDRLTTRMDELTDKLGRLQADLAGVQTKDVVRQGEVAELGRKVDGVRDSRDDIARLRTSLDSISTDVQKAVAVAGNLTSGGQLIDVAALVGRVDALDGLRAALTTPAGNLLSAAEYERRLEALRAQLVTEDDLRSSLDGLREEFGGFDTSSILDEARVAGRAEVDNAIVSFRVSNSAELDRRFSAQDALVDDRVARATGDLTASILDAARNQWQPALNAGLTKLQGTITQAEAARDAATRAAIGQNIAKVENSIGTLASSAATKALDAALADVQARLDANGDRLTAVEKQGATNSTNIAANATKLETTRRNLEAADAKLEQNLSAEISKLSQSIDSRLDARIPTLRSDLRADLQGDISALGRDLETRLNNTIRGTVVTEVGVTSGRLRSDISSVIDTQMAAVREDMNTRIDAGLATNAARVSGLVTNEVRRATADLDTRVERAVNAFIPEIDRRNNPVTPVVIRPGG